MRRAAAAAAAGAWAVTAHTALNAYLLRKPGTPGTRTERVSLLIPARDEERRIGGCVRAALAALPADGELLVLDDGSSDATAAVAAGAIGADPRGRVLTGAPLPPDRLGKPHACEQLAAAADPASTALVFLDADVRLAPDGLLRTLDLLRDNALDAVCPYPRQLADGLLPRLVQPLLQWSWLSFLPLRAAESSSRPSLTAGNGQLLAVDRAAYARCGGHAAVRREVVEDIALVRAVKATGGRGGVADGTALATCRMYEDGAALRAGYAKSLGPALGGPAGATATSVLLLALYVLPVWALGPARTRRLGLLGYAGGVASRVVAARTTGGRSWPDAAAHPLSVLAFAGLVGESLWRRRNGGTVDWKGRPV